MVGLLVLLAFSWLALYIFERKNLAALGFTQPLERFKQFFVGFLFTALICSFSQFLESWLSSSNWVLNQSLEPLEFWAAIWWDIRSVLTEELVFRGALLYLLIQWIGPRKSILISGIAFGVYHWFSYGVFGNLWAMVFVFIGTGIMGLALALGFSKTKSIVLPIGLHLGWNVFYNSVFSKGPLGDLLFISILGNELNGMNSLINFLTGMILVPSLVLFFVSYFPWKNEGFKS